MNWIISLLVGIAVGSVVFAISVEAKLSCINEHLETIAANSGVDIEDAIENALYNHFVKHKFADRVDYKESL